MVPLKILPMVPLVANDTIGNQRTLNVSRQPMVPLVSPMVLTVIKLSIHLTYFYILILYVYISVFLLFANINFIKTECSFVKYINLKFKTPYWIM